MSSELNIKARYETALEDTWKNKIYPAIEKNLLDGYVSISLSNMPSGLDTNKLITYIKKKDASLKVSANDDFRDGSYIIIRWDGSGID